MPKANKNKYILKSTGKTEPFEPKKITESIKRAGGDEKIAQEAEQQVEENLEKIETSADIQQHLQKYLKKKNRPLADRYNLKKAIFDFGPTGFPFEQYIAQLFERLGFSTQTNQIIRGKCVGHEVDVVAWQKGKKHMVEVKFHNNRGITTNVKIPLYVKARFDDINHKNQDFIEPWIVTNTRFTSDSVQYTNCEDINILAWKQPEGQGLAKLIDMHNLHPITALSLLKKHHKKILIKNNVVLVEQIPQNPKNLDRLSLPRKKRNAIINHAKQFLEL
jgi:hypothetical protein